MMPEQSVDRRSAPLPTSQLIIGLTVILVGVLFTLDNLDILDARRYLPFWPIVILVFGLTKLLTADDNRQRVFGGFLTTIGAVLLLGRWGLLHVNLLDLWPLLLIFWGGMIVWRGWRGTTYTVPVSTNAGNTFDAAAFLGGFDRVVTGDRFVGGQINAFMGGGKVDLTRSKMAGGSTAVVNVSAIMGGVELRIPEDWAVDNRVTYFLGGSNDRSRTPSQANPPRVVLRGFVMMGGVDIRN
jgi:predicted membrane protein